MKLLFRFAGCVVRTACLFGLIHHSHAFAAQEPPWVDLLAKVVVDRDAVAGAWRKSPDGLRCESTAGARISIPHSPAGEYDLRVRFTRHQGANSIAIIFTAGGRQASFDVDGWGQHLAGIQQIGGRDMRAYSDRGAGITLQNGRSYTALVKVRRDEVSTYLDDQPIHTHRTSGADLSLLELWKLPAANTLGLGAWDSATTFHSVDIRQPAPSPAGPVQAPAASMSPPASARAGDDLTALSDEFDSATTLGNWLHVVEAERTSAEQLERFDIGRTRKGWMTLVPYTSTWYRDYRGVLAHKRIGGDFVVTTRVHTSGRSGRGAPNSQFSLAGIMVRTPRSIPGQTWRPGGENYIFLSHGAADRPGSYQLEVKTTTNSDSQLEINDTRHAEMEIRVARLGPHFILLHREPGGSWQVHRRYRRADMPRELQVGMTVYTDYGSASRLDPARHNVTVIRQGNPDLIASFDYFRFRRPAIPATFRERALSNPAEVADAELLSFLGDAADRSR
jgi:hypothetical protein